MAVSLVDSRSDQVAPGCTTDDDTNDAPLHVMEEVTESAPMIIGMKRRTRRNIPALFTIAPSFLNPTRSGKCRYGICPGLDGGKNRIRLITGDRYLVPLEGDIV